MEAFEKYNANPYENNVGDCTVRAISRVLGRDWDTVYIGLFLEGFRLKDMQSANRVWGAYLRRNGFTRRIIPDELGDNYTVRDFCEDHPCGIYLLAIDGHVVAVEDGRYFDTFDSGSEIPLYYWERKGEDNR